MEKPGPGPAARPLIIERPDLQSRPQRVMSMGLTVLFWAVWAYLWLPVLALLGWFFGASRFYEEMVVQEGERAVLEMLGWYGIAVALLAGSLVCWALYNLARFRGRDRRAAHPRIALTQIAEQARVTPDALLRWQQARVLHVGHDAAGRIAVVEDRSPARGQPGAGGEAAAIPSDAAAIPSDAAAA